MDQALESTSEGLEWQTMGRPKGHQGFGRVLRDVLEASKCHVRSTNPQGQPFVPGPVLGAGDAEMGPELEGRILCTEAGKPMWKLRATPGNPGGLPGRGLPELGLVSQPGQE